MIKTLVIDDGSFKPCNFACKYCRKTPSKKLEGGFYDPIRGSTLITQYRIQHSQVMSILENLVESTLYKVSGHGEITLIPEFFDLLPSSSLGRPVIITNGSRLAEKDLKIIVEIDAVLSISLDGHTATLNAARRGNPASILSLICLACEYSIPIEINSVLTKWNIEKFDDFLSFLNRFDNNLMCIPFPVRDFSTQTNESFKASSQQFQVFKTKVLENYHEFNDILPPVPYLENMFSTILTGRQIPCFLPNLILPLNWQYDILKCPCGPTETHGNLLIPDKTLRQWRTKSEDYSGELLFNECHQCYTHYDIVNLYLLDIITSSELANIPSLNNLRSIRYLEEFSKNITKESKSWENQYLSQELVE